MERGATRMPARLECDGCGRYFMTEQPVTMLVALVGGCTCGGRFGATDGGRGAARASAPARAPDVSGA